MATNLDTRAVHAEHFEKECRQTIMSMPAKSINIDYLCATAFPIIDEVGAEVQIGKYGEKYEGVQKVVNVAEQQSKAVFISTNLDGEELLRRYGARTVDRLNHLCRAVVFKDQDSLRK